MTTITAGMTLESILRRAPRANGFSWISLVLTVTHTAATAKVWVFSSRECVHVHARLCVCVGVGVGVGVCVCVRARGGCERVDIHERAVCLHDCTCAAAIISAHKHNTAGDRLMHTAC